MNILVLAFTEANSEEKNSNSIFSKFSSFERGKFRTKIHNPVKNESALFSRNGKATGISPQQCVLVLFQSKIMASNFK